MCKCCFIATSCNAESVTGQMTRAMLRTKKIRDSIIFSIILLLFSGKKCLFSLAKYK